MLQISIYWRALIPISSGRWMIARFTYPHLHYCNTYTKKCTLLRDRSIPLILQQRNQGETSYFEHRDTGEVRRKYYTENKKINHLYIRVSGQPHACSPGVLSVAIAMPRRLENVCPQERSNFSTHTHTQTHMHLRLYAGHSLFVMLCVVAHSLFLLS